MSRVKIEIIDNNNLVNIEEQVVIINLENTGPQGPPGPQGPLGPEGLQGPVGESGTTVLSELEDVSFSSLNQDDILFYNSASSLWLNTSASDILNQDIKIEYIITDNDVNIVDFWDVNLYTTVEYNVQIIQGDKYYTQKLITLNNNNNLFFNSYSIIDIGESMSGLNITSDIDGGNGRLLVQITDASSNNAQVTVLRRTIA